MAKNNKKKCPICGEWGNEDEMIKYNKRYYHIGECEQIYLDEQQKKEAKASDWDMLFTYICELYNIKTPTGMMFKQMETFRKQYGYTDIGMYYTLKYYYYTLENEVLEDTGLGIIPYYYTEATKHYNKIWDIEDAMENFVRDEEERVIKAKPIEKEKFAIKPKEINIDWSEDIYE